MAAVDVPTTCPSCGGANTEGARFCSHCGASLEQQVGLAEERKLVSILFADLVGFTARSDGADPEDVRDALQLYHADAKQRIEEHGGVLEKFIGDAVMAVFGAPIAHGDDAERAVRAALSVLEGITLLNREHELGLSARAAVNTGEAVVSLGLQQGEALAMGDVVNTASRLQTAAPAGRVIVGTETYRATRQAIRYEQTITVEAKGKARPLEAWLAVEPTTAPAERPLAARRLVGRRQELELLRSIWARTVAERRPHLVTVVGPPGIGKSTLCREVAALVAADDGKVLRGRCLPYGGQAGYQAFSFLVRDASGIIASDPPPVARERLDAAVAAVMPSDEAADTVRYLSLLLGLVPADDVQVNRMLLFFAARRFLECVGLAHPTLLVFEDVHWAQASEMELLEHLAQRLRDAPLVLIALARQELLGSRPTWGGGLVPQTTILLEPLSADEAAELVTSIVDEFPGRTLDLDRLVEVSGGNPLFLEELAASVLELGDAGALPVTVREAISARIDALPAEARAALLSAAVVGRTFWRGILDTVSKIPDLDEALSMLEVRGLVRHDHAGQISGDAQFTFKHMLIREVAYATVPRAARRELHAKVARAIEEAVEDSAETFRSILAYHWSEGGEPGRAIPYLLGAAQAARRSWAQSAVVDLYSKALELAEDEELKRRIRLERGLALVEIQQYERAAEELADLVPELAGPERLDALISRGHATLWTERDEETLAIAQEALPLARELGDQSAVAAALAMESQALAMRGAEGDVNRALELGDKALEVWVPGTRSFDLTQHLHLHADAKYWSGEYDQAVELSRRTRAMARDVFSAESLLRGGGFEALALAGLGRHEEAIAIWDEMLELAKELGHNPAAVLNYSALAYRQLYDLDEARVRNERALELTADLTFGMPTQFARSDLLFTQLLAGDVGGAQAAWPALWEGAEKATAWTTWLVAGRLAAARAEIAVQAEPAESAVEWARRAIEIARRTRRRKYEGRSLTSLGEGMARLGRRNEALEALREGAAIADALVGAPERWRAHATLGRVAYELGDDDDAGAAYAEARRLIVTFAAQLAPERSTRFLAAPPVREILSSTGT